MSSTPVKTPAASAKVEKETKAREQRRRLSVVSATNVSQKIIDGSVESKEKVDDAKTASVAAPTKAQCFRAFHTLTKTGFVPFNTGKVNQDRPCAVTPFMGEADKAVFGCFDGHGSVGHEVSQYVTVELPKHIALQKDLATAPEVALDRAFVDCNTKLCHSKVDCTFSGTTVVVCYINGKTIYSCNAGDSRAVLGKMVEGKMTAVDLSDDHKPERPDEKKRILLKGRVEACKGMRGEDIGPARVWLKHEDVPGLAMSRSFGDMIAASVGVIPNPEIFKRTLDSNDKFMILASDGVWEFITSQEAVDIINNAKTGELACKAIVDESVRRWQQEEEVIDDITCVIVYF